MNSADPRRIEGSSPSSMPKVVVATTVALSFISFWRAAAVVLSDLASSAFYAGGIAEQAVGKSGSLVHPRRHAVQLRRALRLPGKCSMFVRGGVYVVVRDAMDHFMARLSVSALIFDYILTGPDQRRQRRPVPRASVQRDLRDDAHRSCASARTCSRPASASSSRSISGGATSRESTNPAARRCGSCRSPP